MVTKEENKMLWIMFGIAFFMLFVGLFPMIRASFVSQHTNTPIVATTHVSPTPTITPQAITIYTPDDVAKHNVITDCWVIIKGKVYDATKLIQQLDNGQGIQAQLPQMCGQDGTAIMDQTMKSKNLGMLQSTLDSYLAQLAIGKVASVSATQ